MKEKAMTTQELINERQQLFETVKPKAVKCTDRTQLCAAIYPWVLHLVREYADKPTTRYAVESFREELYDFHRAMSVHLLAIPQVVSPDSNPLDLKRIRDEALEVAIDMAVSVANLEVDQISIKLSDVMARFAEDL
jgi:hypothetical protein